MSYRLPEEIKSYIVFEKLKNMPNKTIMEAIHKSLIDQFPILQLGIHGTETKKLEVMHHVLQVGPGLSLIERKESLLETLLLIQGRVFHQL